MSLPWAGKGSRCGALAAAILGSASCAVSAGELKSASTLGEWGSALIVAPPAGPSPIRLALETRLAGAVAAPPQLQSLIATVRLNEQDEGEHVVQMSTTGEFFVKSEALRKWAPLAPPLQSLRVDGEAYVGLSQLAGARVEFDEGRLELKITLPPDAFPKQVFAYQHSESIPPTLSNDPSALLNYSLGYGGSTRDSSSQVSLALEANVHYRDWLFRSQGFYTRAPDSPPPVRGLTTLSRDDPIRLTRLSFGDTQTALSELTGGVVLGGVSYSRAFELDPYLVRQPTATYRAAVDLPSQVDVYVGNTRIYRQNVAPGPFELGNLTFLTGRRDVRVVVRDVFGREREVNFPFYFADRGLAPGVQDFSYALGKVRENTATESADYGRTAFSANHRVGVNDVLTLGAQAEGTGEFVNGGPSMVLRSDRLGILSLALLASIERGDRRKGGSGAISYSYQSGGFAAFVAARKSQRGFAFLRASDGVPLPLADNTASLSYSVEKFGTLALTYHHLAAADDTVTKTTSLTYSIPFGRQWMAQASYRRIVGFGAGYEWFAGIQYFPTPQFSTFTSVRVDEKTRTGSFQAGNLIPEGEGVGYRVGVDIANGPEGTTRTLTPEITYQARYATVQANVTSLSNSAGNTSLYTVSVAGALAYVGGNFGFSRPIDDSFALARVDPPMAGVRVYLNQQETGRTGADGTLFLPRVVSYVQNNIGIDDRDVPIENTIDEKSRILVPYSHSGSLLVFKMPRTRSISGALRMIKGGESRPVEFALFSLDVGGVPIEVPTGRNGDFYFENVPAGSYRATIELAGRPCRFELTIPVSDESFLRLPDVPTCSIP